MPLGIDNFLNTPSYIIAAIGAIAATVKWLLGKQRKHDEDIRIESQKYVDTEIQRIESIHKNYDNTFKNMEKSISHIESKVTLLDSVQQDIAILKSSMEFLKQMMWGRDTKSDTPYLLDEVETQRHKDSVESGIFKPTEEEQAERDSGDFSTQKDE